MIFPDGLTYPYFFLFSAFFCIVFFSLFLLKKGKKNFSSRELLQEVYGKNQIFGYIFFLLSLGITLVFFTLFSRPYISQSIEKQVKNGIDISVVMDLSYSMNARDISPSRIESAKSSLRAFISQLESDRLGMVLFAGKPFQSIPLSFDYDFVDDFVSEISVETINQNNSRLAGTAIGDAIVLASDTLEKDQEREKIMILITDGSANTGIDPIIAAKYAAEKNIKIYALGVGKDENTFVEIISPLGFVQRTPIGPVDERALREISRLTGGTYYRADDAESFKNILREIAELEKSEIEYEDISFHRPVFVVFFLCFLFLYTIFFYILFIKKIRF